MEVMLYCICKLIYLKFYLIIVVEDGKGETNENEKETRRKKRKKITVSK